MTWRDLIDEFGPWFSERNSERPERRLYTGRPLTNYGEFAGCLAVFGLVLGPCLIYQAWAGPPMSGWGLARLGAMILLSSLVIAYELGNREPPA
jgi:hypothetical protein